VCDRVRVLARSRSGGYFLRYDLHRRIVSGRPIRRADYTAAKRLTRDEARRMKRLLTEGDRASVAEAPKAALQSSTGQ
jgi:hypothetical protein